MEREVPLAATGGGVTLVSFAGSLWAAGISALTGLGARRAAVPPQPFETVEIGCAPAALAPGHGRTVVVGRDGSLWVAGGAGPFGGSRPSSRFARVVAPTGLVVAAPARGGTVALDDSGLLWWAAPPNSEAEALEPRWVTIATTEPVVEIAMGSSNLCVLDAAGGVWSVPLDPSRLATRPVTPQARSLEAPPAPVTKIAAGGHHVLAICSDGSLWGAGENGGRQLGFELPRHLDSFYEIPLPAPAVDIAGGWEHSTVVCSNGEVYSTGTERGTAPRPTAPPTRTPRPFSRLECPPADRVSAAGGLSIIGCGPDLLALDVRPSPVTARAVAATTSVPFPLLPMFPPSLTGPIAEAAGTDPVVVAGLARTWSGTLGSLLEAARDVGRSHP